MENNKKNKITEELIKTTNEVRRKCNSLKRSKYDEDLFFEETFKPITKPLKHIADKISINSTNQQGEEQEQSSSRSKRPKTESESYDESKQDKEKNDNDDGNRQRILYFLTLLESRSMMIDKSYGIYIKFVKNEKVYKIGNASITWNNSKINIEGKEYVPTEGLCELLFLKDPRKDYYTQNDLDNYSEILVASKAYYRHFDESQQIKGSNSPKYVQIIKPIIIQQNQKNKEKQHTGKGFALMQLPKENVDYIYWDDPNEIVDRLRLLISSSQAGHNSHNNEIMSIIEELREAQIII